MATNQNTTCTNVTTGLLDLSRYFSDSTLTLWQYNSWMNIIDRYEGENPRIPRKVLHNVKPKVRHYDIKPLKNMGYTKQFTDHSFRIGKSKK